MPFKLQFFAMIALVTTSQKAFLESADSTTGIRHWVNF